MTREPTNCHKARQASRKHNFLRLSGSFSINTSVLLLVGCLAVLPSCSQAFNVDLTNYVHHKYTPNSLFGYSLAFFKGSDPRSHALLVGAPKLSTKGDTLPENGGVFKCSMQDDNCGLVPFDLEYGDTINNYGDIISRKSHQMFGATVATSRDSDVIVACAPHFIFHTMTPRQHKRYDPVGTCFVSRNFSSFHEVSPCRTSYYGYHRQGSCQAGFSAALSKNGERVYIGAPGSWFWQGQVYSVWPDLTFPYKPKMYAPFGTGGTAFSHDVTSPANTVYSTMQSDKAYDNSYFGYAVTTGDFDGDGKDDIAIGMPRGEDQRGKVVINHWDMRNMFNISGRQMGEYFSYALATGDIDGDGLDDLIIGAPMYTETNQDDYDVGRVYVLLQRARSGPTRWDIEFQINGYKSRGRFGTALASLGDINRDRYGDFAVGAPYDGPNGHGVVYIFHGSKNGPLTKPSQVIKPEDLAGIQQVPRTFGFSLAGGVDMDGNTYPDLAIGAYASDQAFIFRSRPVAVVNARTTFLAANKLIDITKKNCKTRRTYKQVVCTELSTCWNYTGQHLPNSLEFDVSWVLDAKKLNRPRMFFYDFEGNNIRTQSISLTQGQIFCMNKTVYVADDIKDKLTPLEVETRYSLRSVYNSAANSRNKRELEPVIDQNREMVPRDAINIQKNCGEDNICIPDLRLEIKTVNDYVLDSKKDLTIDVMISNVFEDAYEAKFFMIMPKDVNFKKTVQLSNKTDFEVICTPESDVNNTLSCEIGNPLTHNNFVNFQVILEPLHREGMGATYEFYMEANSTNLERENTRLDNIVHKTVGILVENDLIIDGSYESKLQTYNISNYKPVAEAQNENDLGPDVTYVYRFINKGPSVIDEAEIIIYYPYETVGGDLLMYLTDQPDTWGQIKCDHHYKVNSKHLTIDPRRESILVAAKAVSPKETYMKSQIPIQFHNEDSSVAGNEVAVNRAPIAKSKEELELLHAQDTKMITGDGSFQPIPGLNNTFSSSEEPFVPVNRRNNSYYEARQPANYQQATFARLNSYQSPPQQELRHDSQLGAYVSTRPYIVKPTQAPPYSAQNGHVAGYYQSRLPEKYNDNYRNNMNFAQMAAKPDDQLRVGTINLDQLNGGIINYPKIQPIYNNEKPFYGWKEQPKYQDQHRRFSRQADSSSDGASEEDLNPYCKAARCQTIRCTASNLTTDPAFFIGIRARMVAHTLAKLAPDMPLNVSTMAVAYVTKLPNIGAPSQEIKKSHEIFYKAVPELKPVPEVVPLWVVVLAACAGTLILLIIIFLLYKCGFFKRNRPMDHTMERQPLRNGYHGDEHL